METPPSGQSSRFTAGESQTVDTGSTIGSKQIFASNKESRGGNKSGQNGDKSKPKVQKALAESTNAGDKNASGIEFVIPQALNQSSPAPTHRDVEIAYMGKPGRKPQLSPSLSMSSPFGTSQSYEALVPRDVFNIKNQVKHAGVEKTSKNLGKTCI